MPRIIGRSAALTTPWFDVRVKRVKGLPTPGRNAYYYSVRPADYVSILALTDRDEVLLVRQYRPAVEVRTLELPSGLVDAGEAPVRSARRELLEETGYRASRMDLMGVLRPDVGRLENRLWCFRASGLRSPGRGFSGEAGVTPVLMKRPEFTRRIRRGEFDHALHLAVILLALAQGKWTLA